MDSEAPLYARAHVLVDQLKALKIEGVKSIESLIEEIWVWAYEHGYIEMRDVHLVQAWIESLRVVNYQFPAI